MLIQEVSWLLFCPPSVVNPYFSSSHVCTVDIHRHKKASRNKRWENAKEKFLGWDLFLVENRPQHKHCLDSLLVCLRMQTCLGLSVQCTLHLFSDQLFVLEIAIALHGATHCICYTTFSLFLKLHCTYRLGVLTLSLELFSNKFTYCGSCPSDREGFYLSDFTGLAFPQQLKWNRMPDILWADLYQWTQKCGKFKYS